MNFAMSTLGLKEMGKFFWEGRGKGLPCWLSHCSFGKCKKVWYYEKWAGRHASFPPRRSVKKLGFKKLVKLRFNKDNKPDVAWPEPEVGT